MEPYRILFEVIGLRSFSTLWYWIVVILFWTQAGSWLLGTSWALVRRARAGDEEAARDVEVLARIHARRCLGFVRAAPGLLLFLIGFLYAALGLLAFRFRVELAEALMFLAVPALIISGLSLRAALRLEAGGAVIPTLVTLRRWIWLMSFVFIFVTALYGTWHNLNHAVLNGSYGG